MESNPKEIRRSDNEEVIDRISNLPDSILSKILSHLPTKHAVGASILSTRWKNLSPFAILPITLNLDDSLILHPKQNESNFPSTSFTDFVNKLLNVTLSDVPCVKAMCLTCHNKSYGDAKILSWVSVALRLNVQRLSLRFSLTESYALFRNLNGCTTLVRLMLVLETELCLPESFSLPNLKSLELQKLTLDTDETDEVDFFGVLIGGCPALEDLCMTDCNMGCCEYLTINSLMLKNLKIEKCFTHSICVLSLGAPNLEVLQLNDHVAFDYSVTYFKCLLAAHISVGLSQIP